MSDGSFVGREDELARLAELLAPEGALVSLVGPPGVGTSRLGREVAARFTRTKLVPGAALAKVRARDVESLELLIVDDVAARVLAVLEELEVLREEAPALRVLVIGDEALGGAGEQVVELGGLSEEAALRLAVELAAAPADGSDPRTSLRRTFDAVWETLTDDEQQALAATAVLASPARLEEIEAMIDAPAGLDPLVAIETLVRRHLLLRAGPRLALAPLLAAYLQLRTRGDARFATLPARHAELVRARPPAPVVAAAEGPGWHIAADAVQALAPDGSRIDLRTRPVLRRILAALVNKRLAAPGEALDVEGILAAGWPGERVQQAAGALRAYTAIKRLRAVGLTTLVCTAEDGYLLDAAVPVSISATPL